MIQWNLKVKKRKLPPKTWGTNSPLYLTLHESFLYQSTSKVKKNICSFRLPMNLNWICLTIFSIESLLTQIFLNGNLHSIKCVIGNYLSPKYFIPGKLQVMNVSKVKTDDVSQSESLVNQLLPIEVKTCDLPISDFRMLCSLELWITIVSQISYLLPRLGS